MRDQNQQVAADLPLADHEESSPKLAIEEPKKRWAASFMDDWPAPPKCNDDDQMDEVMRIQVRKWRLQTLLAVSPYGVPSLALAKTYERMFGVPFDYSDFDCSSLVPDLIDKMADIMIIQEPDETTPILFPDYPTDTILHDARLGHNFSEPNLDGDEQVVDSSRTGAKDCNDLILRAWVDRDLDFPEDVALAGETFDDLHKISLASPPGSRGLYRASIVGTGSPESIYIRLKASDEMFERINGLSHEFAEYFKETKHPIDAYNVPEQFINHDFPCLLYSQTDRTWTRCIIIGRSDDDKVIVDSIDFSGIYAVNKIFLYLIPRKFLHIPRLTYEVSLAGVKPARGEWTKSSKTRMRCFSMKDYYLDVVLLDTKEPINLHRASVAEAKNGEILAPLSPSDSNASNESGQASDGPQTCEGIMKLDAKSRKRFKKRTSFSAIIIDRNDEDLDIYVDEIMILETYAIQDAEQAAELAKLKAQLPNYLDKVPRPTNPNEPIFKD